MNFFTNLYFIKDFLKQKYFILSLCSLIIFVVLKEIYEAKLSFDNSFNQEEKDSKYALNLASGFSDNLKKLTSGKTVIGLVFYGRKPQAQILMRYLERNLKINGGVLDKFIFAVNTDKNPDLDYLETIMSENVGYYERVNLTNQNFVNFYHILKDEDIVFKIDDDIVFIANGTFEKMLEEYFSKNASFLSANVINHTLLSHVHSRLRAILPFYERNKTFVLDKNKTELDGTEAYSIEYKLGTKWWTSGYVAAIVHESFMYHFYNNNLDVYDFKRWDFHTIEYTRWSINFILFKGKYVNKMTGESDEESISNHIAREHGSHGYALGSAIVSHFSYFPQIDYLLETDLLQKYDKLSKHYFGINN